MQNTLSVNLKIKIENEVEQLKYWKYQGSPHNEPDEGFVYDTCKVAISFPINKNTYL